MFFCFLIYESRFDSPQQLEMALPRRTDFNDFQRDCTFNTSV